MGENYERFLALLAIPALLSGLSTVCFVYEWASGGPPRDPAEYLVPAICASPLLLFVGIVAAGFLARHWEDTAPQREAARKRLQERHATQQQERQLQEAEQQRLKQEQKVQQEREKAVAAAVSEVEKFYRDHAGLLAETCPPALFRANVQALILRDASAEQAWAAARDLIATLQPVVEEVRNRRRAREKAHAAPEKRRQEIQREIGRCHRKVEQLAGSPLDAHAKDVQRWTLESRIRELEEESEELLSRCGEVDDV